jgi:hypothetical protein
MFRFALAYQGGGGRQVILSGTAIDLKNGTTFIELGESQTVDVLSGEQTLNLSAAGKAIDAIHDRNSFDL